MVEWMSLSRCAHCREGLDGDVEVVAPVMVRTSGLILFVGLERMN